MRKRQSGKSESPKATIAFIENIVARAIGSLQLNFRELLILSDVLDLSYNQIAELLQYSAEKIPAQLHEARQKLRFELIHLTKICGINIDTKSSSFEEFKKFYAYSAIGEYDSR